MIESVRNYIASCPHLKNGRLNVDFLGHKQKEFSIETEPVNPVVKQYVNGDSIRQFVFLIVFRGPYGVDLKQNTANIELFEKITDWLESQNQQQNFPLLAENQDVISIKTLSQGLLIKLALIRQGIKCNVNYFNKIFGEGTDKKIFGDKTNLRICYEAVETINAESQKQKNYFENLVQKYSPERLK